MDFICDVNGIAELVFRTEWRNGLLVEICPQGTAAGADYLTNRGLDLPYEVTCWPRPKTHAFRLTTGGGGRPKKLHPYAHETWAVQQATQSEAELYRAAEACAFAIASIPLGNASETALTETLGLGATQDCSTQPQVQAL